MWQIFNIKLLKKNLDEERDDHALRLTYREFESAKRSDRHGEVGQEEGDDEYHGDPAEEWLVQFRQHEVRDEGQDQEDVGDGATDGIRQAGNANLQEQQMKHGIGLIAKNDVTHLCAT